MNNRPLLLLFSIIVFSTLTYSWTPGNPTVDWSKAGTSAMGLPPGDWVTVHNWSELSNALSVRDRSTLTQITIDTTNAIYISTPIVLDSNVIITGYGPKSRLLFNVGDDDNCIEVSGNFVGSEIDIDDSFPECINFASDSLVLEDASTINPGDYIQFYVDHNDVWNTNYGTYSNIGQILKITSKDGNTIFFNDSLNLDFANYPTYNAIWGSLNPRIRKVKPAHHVGIEDLFIGRSGTGVLSHRNKNNIQFYCAADCWVSRIESHEPTYNHISLEKSVNIKIDKSFFENGNWYYGGGQAYGILISNTTTNCLIENNVFHHLRHSVCFAGGANGNVVAYNYSKITVFATDDSPIVTYTDIPCSDYYFHGHYPFSNLLEGNMGQYIHFENTWGSNGPNNMIFKNANVEHDESFGIQINEGHPNQNVVGNYITYKWSHISLISGADSRQKLDILSDGIYQYHNYDNGFYWDGIHPLQWDWDFIERRGDWDTQGSDNDLPDSYYLSGEPDFWDEDTTADNTWPYVARSTNYSECLKNKLPARKRYRTKTHDLNDFTFVKIKNVDYSTGSLIEDGYLSLKRKHYSEWYDSIPSNADIKMPSIEDTIDVKVLQENLTAKKHHDWDDQRTIFKIQSSNHLIGQDDEIKANYRSQNTASASWTEPVKVYLKDPWYVSDPELLTQPETYREISSGVSFDVFLEEGGEINNLQYPYYSVRAPKFYATANAVYEFSHWSSPNGKATFDPNNVTNSSGCGVRFDEDGAIIKPNYDAVNQIANYNLNIPSDETLTIPAGANIQVADGFTFNVDGTLEIEGTKEQPITLYSSGCSGTSPYGYYTLNNPDDILINAENTGATLILENAVIHDTYCGISLKASNQNVIIRNVEMYNTNIGVEIKDLTDAAVVLDSVYIHDSDIGIAADDIFPDSNQKSQLALIYSVFADNDFDLFLIPSNETTTSSELYLTVLNCDFYNSIKAIIINEQPTGNSYGETIFDITNSIFYETDITISGNSYLKGITSDNIAYNTGGLSFLSNPITSNPCFIDPNNGDFRLGINSPGIDAGFDFDIPSSTGNPPNHFTLSQNSDPDGTDIDIGGLYFPQTTFSGTIASDTSWYGRITVTGDVTVNSGVELTIDPGSLIMFNSGKEINVNGTITADGTANAHIVFNRSDPNSTSKSYWNRININGSAGYTLDHIEMYGSSYGIRIYNNSGGIVQNSLFRENYRAFYLYNADNTTIRNCDMIANNYGIYSTNSNGLWIENNFVDSSYYYGIYMYRSDGGIRGNIIRNSIAYDGIRAYYLSGPDLSTSYDVDHIQINNTIANHNRYGVSAYSSSDVDLGTYLFIGTDYLGGFNYFNRGGSVYDVYNYNSGTIKAECNWWSSMNNSGSVDTSPTAGSLGFSLPKETGGRLPSEAETLLAEAYYQEKVDSAYAEAISTLNHLAEIAVNDVIVTKVVIRLGRLYRKLGDIEGLKENLDALFQKYSDKLAGRIALDYSVSVYSGEGNFAEALNRLEKVICLWSEIPSARDELACALFEQGLIYMDMDSTSFLGKKSVVAAQNSFNRLIENYPETDAARLAAEILGLERINPTAVNPLPSKFALRNNYPNPFNPMTTIEYDLPEEGRVTLIIYDIIGREATRLVDTRAPAGFYKALWDGRNKNGQLVSSGVYLYRIVVENPAKGGAGNFSRTNKMIFMR